MLMNQWNDLWSLALETIFIEYVIQVDLDTTISLAESRANRLQTAIFIQSIDPSDASTKNIERRRMHLLRSDNILDRSIHHLIETNVHRRTVAVAIIQIHIHSFRMRLKCQSNINIQLRFIQYFCPQPPQKYIQIIESAFVCMLRNICTENIVIRVVFTRYRRNLSQKSKLLHGNAHFLQFLSVSDREFNGKYALSCLPCWLNMLQHVIDCAHIETIAGKVMTGQRVQHHHAFGQCVDVTSGNHYLVWHKGCRDGCACVVEFVGRARAESASVVMRRRFVTIQCDLFVPMRTYQSHTDASSVTVSQVRYFRDATKGAVIRLARATSLPTNRTVAKITALAMGITQAVLIILSRWTH